MGTGRRGRLPSLLAPLALLSLLATVVVVGSPPAGADHDGSVFLADNATSMDLAGGYVLYSSYTGCDPGSEFPPTCQVRYAKATDFYDHGDPRIDFSNEVGTPGPADVASNIAVAGDYVYWVDRGGRLQRLPRYTRGSATTVVATLGEATATSEVVTDGIHVYWTENRADGSGRLYRTRGPGIAPQLLVHNPDRHLRQLQVDRFGGALYVTTHPVFFLCCVDMLERVSVDTAGAVTVSSTDVQGVQAFTVDHRGSVYFIDQVGTAAPALHEAPIEDLADDVVLRTLDGAGSPEFPAMTAVGDDLYWQPLRSAQGPIVRMSRHGGTEVPVTGNLPRVEQLQANDDHLFALATTDIHRFELDVPGTALDIVGDAPPEVVQVIQNEAHDVPLVAGKRTFVRVYGRLPTVDAGGPSEVDLASPVLLYGTRDGAPLPGSPLRPETRQPIPAGAVDRTNLDTTYLFDLPSTWRHGTVTLRSVFNGARSFVELDHTNNEATRTVSFHETTGVCLDMLPVLTHAGVSAVEWTPEAGAHMARALSMFPVEEMYPIWRGGTPRTIPGTSGDHYNMRDTDHKNMLIMNLNAELGWQGAPAGCGSDRLIRTVLVPDSNNFGLSAGIGPYIYALADSDDPEPPQNQPRGGTDGVAHEVGHQFGFAHVLCPTMGNGVPGWPYETYPYDSCTIDDTNDHIGFDVLSQQLVVPFAADGTPNASDFNSYGPAINWASRYTFDKIFSQVRVGGTALAGVGAAGTGAEDTGDPIDPPPPADAKVVVGFLVESPTTGTVDDAVMAHTNVATGPPLAALRDRLLDPTVADASERYELRTHDDAGTLLTREPLTVGHTTDQGDGPTTEFVHLVPEDPAIARIEVFDTDVNVALVARDGGTHSPAVTIDAPSAGDVVGDPMTIEWTSTDADGDDLAHLVRHSTDGGATWQVLASGVVGDQLVVDTALVSGGTDNLVEVFASDGVHSTSARVGPFTLPTHAPSVAVMTDGFDPLDATTGTTISQGDALVLRGHGYDAEEGVLRDEALSWEVTGPVTRVGEGELLTLTDLPPGAYEVALTGTDGHGTVATAGTTVTVLAKQVVGVAAPVLDGECDDAAYGADDDPMWLPYADGTLLAMTMVHNDGDLYACVSGLPGDLEDTSTLSLRIDPDAGGGSVVGVDDLVVELERNNLRSLARGDGAGGEVDVSDPVGVTGVVGGGLDRWNAEVRLDGDRLGPFGPLLRVRAAHESGASGGGATWPAEAMAGVPDSWGLASLGGDTPPTVTVPTTIRVPAEGPEGAVVTFDVTVTDEEDPRPTVTCEPASGSVFPIGTTTVTCTGRDAAGNLDVASFDVVVVPTSRTDKQAVRDALKAMLPTGDQEADAAITRAVQSLDQALASEAWTDGDRLDPEQGKAVFDLEKAAVDALAQLSQPPLGVTGVIDDVVDVDQALATTAIEDAEAATVDHADGDPKELEKAHRELQRAHDEVDRAVEEREAGRHAQAILRFRQAWFRAQEAIALAESAG